MLDFFQKIYGSAEGFVPVVTYPQGERNSRKPWKDWRLNKYRWFQWPQQAEELVTYCTKLRKEDVYVTPALFTKPGTGSGGNTKDNVAALCVVHCDADTANPALFTKRPTVIVESSPGRYQLYWALDKPCTDPAKVEPVAKAIAYSQREFGADTGWQMNKLLRVPGTTNTKPSYDRPKVKVTITAGKPFKLKALAKAFKSKVGVHQRGAVRDRVMGEMPAYHDVLKKIPATNTKIMELLQRTPDGPFYKASFSLAKLLFKEGLSAEEVFVVCTNAPSNKYERDNRDPMEMWRDVCKAEVEAASRTLVFTHEDENKNPIAVEVDAPEYISFLSNKERKMITPTFIEDYVEWAKERAALSDPKYHQAFAMIVLSTILADYGYVYPKFGSVGLHMFFMQLGVTTKSHKTTAAKLCMKILKGMGEDREFPYALDDDQTPENIVVDLAERGPHSSIFHFDEAQGLIAASANGTYMKGFTNVLLKLYDAELPSRGRVKSISTKGGHTYPTVSLMGVPESMTANLTKEDWQKGLLPRFIYVLGTPMTRNRKTLRLEQGDANEQRDVDKRMSDLIKRLKHIRYHWQRRVNKEAAGAQVQMRFDDDAWDRWNELQYLLEDISEDSEDAESMAPFASRMQIAVMKLAALIAMSESAKTVSMRHIVTAIGYSEDWYNTAQVMARLTDHNHWSRQVDDLVTWLCKYPNKTWAETARKFKHFRPREFSELVEAGVKSGRIVEYKHDTGNGLMITLEAVK